MDSSGAVRRTFPVPVGMYRAFLQMDTQGPAVVPERPCAHLRHWWLRQIISRYIIYPSSRGRVRHASCALQWPVYNHLDLGPEGVGMGVGARVGARVGERSSSPVM